DQKREKNETKQLYVGRPVWRSPLRSRNLYVARGRHIGLAAAVHATEVFSLLAVNEKRPSEIRSIRIVSASTPLDHRPPWSCPPTAHTVLRRLGRHQKPSPAPHVSTPARNAAPFGSRWVDAAARIGGIDSAVRLVRVRMLPSILIPRPPLLPSFRIYKRASISAVPAPHL
uniref:Uncharacterized protein n=1 Tax=Aegilops tauschii subsp. strangulata TaxID=200361 RepID=A0A453KCI1_AEGTS